MNLKELILLIAIFIGIIAGYAAGVLQEKGKIELPEESDHISSSFRNPDTLLGYKKNGVLHIELKK